MQTYKKYLDFLDNNILRKFFEQQKDYLCCKDGCSHCCEIGEYPYSLLEFKYLMSGYENLDDKTKNSIHEKIKKIIENKKANNVSTFLYECPFLINKRCCLYEHRGLVCRTHGLLFFVTDEENQTRNKIPSCVKIGLNYSKVYDSQKHMISQELWVKSGIIQEPLAYNISRDALMNSSIAKDLGLNFGDSKTLIDFLIDSQINKD